MDHENIIESTPLKDDGNLVEDLEEIDRMLTKVKEKISNLKSILGEILEDEMFNGVKEGESLSQTTLKNYYVARLKEVMARFEEARDLFSEAKDFLSSLDNQMKGLLGKYNK